MRTKADKSSRCRYIKTRLQNPGGAGRIMDLTGSWLALAQSIIL
ncbi:MAG: hypothetical protein R6U08_07760 [Bacillota bacterium]